jgi:anterior pharynx defective protein 1
MTVMEFFGCGFIAFGPALALFIFTIARDPLRVIVLMASGFFWLLALLLSSLLWFAVVPLREDLAFGLVFSVIFQELFRLGFFLMLRKAEEGLQKVSQNEGISGMQLVNNKHLMAYVAGLGFGITSGAFSLVNVLADMTGPGTIGIYGHSDLFFITSAFMTLCFIFLHTFWGVLFYDAVDKKKWVQLGLVVASHMLVSCLTLLNQSKAPIYVGSMVPAYAVMVATGIWSYFVAGGSITNIKAFILNKHAGYNLD